MIAVNLWKAFQLQSLKQVATPMCMWRKVKIAENSPDGLRIPRDCWYFPHGSTSFPRGSQRFSTGLVGRFFANGLSTAAQADA